MNTIDHFENKTFLITGGYGFIGSHLVRRLLRLQAKIVILTRKSSNPWRLKDVSKSIKLYEVDIRDKMKVQNIIKKNCPDYIFHLAAYGVNSAHTDYMNAIETNVLGTINIIQAAKSIDCKKIINIGSSSEYGNQTDSIHEGMALTPIDIYGSSKAAATILAHQIAAENNTNLITLRPFGIFGEGEEPHKIFCYIILQVLQNRTVDLTLCNQLRDYCYIDNIIDACMLTIENNSVRNEIFNIGSGEIYSLKHYVELLFKHLQTDNRPNYGALSYRTNERTISKPNINKIKSMLSWEPRISIEEGIIKTVNWYKHNAHLYLNV
ncbi:NAD-dependent epimerase/dehydratase family protein [Bacillus pseudomycoides]|uniref:CDP-abequose synthase n=1 Tax=Bacillus pseudomycoides TaxID=64104 RepID=A0A2C3QMB3_9BACI|nr:SDR family NAD(P)-dependent oxidoreductase [Bacillus pseudomycoides]PDY45676.1 CDP-abequose synthase [Bacillus pseudomycoides]PEA83750.1 CDP-abequose synthase [Bacillus pseudomycoides]PED08632.1 CDP-abequose synthase [Bacillus pseudomycoides]PED69975.1 CDP-abequose synthase [Bacillus pseudomycoides]PEI41498.1 CDP-abequose synthase [Bacillus pseudomycoides]